MSGRRWLRVMAGICVGKHTLGWPMDAVVEISSLTIITC